MSTAELIQDIAAPTEEFIDCFEPGTKKSLGRVPVDGPKEVQIAIAQARNAQAQWARSSFDNRRKVLGRVLEHVLDNSDSLCEAIVRDSGKTRENAMMGEIWPVAEKLRWTIAHGEKHLRSERVSPGLMVHKTARIEYHPLGVIGGIIPWNYPLQNVMNPIIPALMAGNAAVIKASEWVAWSSQQFAKIFENALVQEGFDPALVRVLNGYGATGEALIRSGVDGVIFIGSVRNGRKVIEASAQNITPVIMELGGKDPFIVCDDADLEQAAHAAINGCFINCGQNCVASERILVMQEVYGAFEAKVKALTDKLRQGPGIETMQGGPVYDVGAMVTPLQLELVERLVKRAVEQGARIVTGAERTLSERGDYFAPTILADVTPDMEIMQEETFGPVMLLCRVRDDLEAISIANDTHFGLSSSVFTKSRERGHRIAASLKAGMTGINEYGGATYMAQDLPFGGVKQSGFGRLNGRDGLRAMTNAKAVLDDRFPLYQANRVYPVGQKDYDVAREVIQLVYKKGLKNKLRSAGRLARAFLK